MSHPLFPNIHTIEELTFSQNLVTNYIWKYTYGQSCYKKVNFRKSNRKSLHFHISSENLSPRPLWFVGKPDDPKCL